MFLESDYCNSITSNQILLVGPAERTQSSSPDRPHADVRLRGTLKEKYGRPLVSKECIAEWPSITTLRREAIHAPSAQTPCLIRGRVDWKETVHKEKGLINIFPVDEQSHAGEKMTWPLD